MMSTVRIPALASPWKDRGWIIWPAIFLCVLVWMYGSILKGLTLQWWSDPDYGHGFFVPAFAAYVLWRERDRWLATKGTPSNSGFVLMLAAVFFLLVGSLGAELFSSRLSLLLLLTGIIVFLFGWNMLRAVSFPVFFLILMIPIPAIIYNQVTFPLQLLTSRWAAYLLETIGVPVLRDGNILVLSNYSLEVVEACSGIRSLMSLVALAVAYGYLAEPSRRVRVVLVFLMVPIALITNAIRITVAGVLAHRFGPTTAEGFLHEFSGWVIFLSAILLMFACHRMLRLFVTLLDREPVA